MKITNNWLIFAGIGSFGVAGLHIAIPFLGPWAYGYFGAAQLMPAAQSGSLLPAALTWGLAGLFALFGLYALSGAGVVRLLPLVWFILPAIALIYLLRGLLLIPEAISLLQGALHPARRAFFSAASLAIGVLYSVGFFLFWRSKRMNDNPAPG